MRIDVIRSNLAAVMGLWQAKHNQRLSIRELAKHTGLSLDFLYRFQNGAIELLHLPKLLVLCNFFQVTPNDLLWVNEESGDADKSPVTKPN